MLDTLAAAIRSDMQGNRTVFEALQASGGQPQNALAAFQHVLETEMTWTLRMQGQDSSHIPLWEPEPSLAQCEAWLNELQSVFDDLITRLFDEELGREFSYRRQSGDAYTNRVGEALLHMLLHSAQYRGEAMGFLNATGAQVRDTDFIFFLRTYTPPAS